MTSLSQVNARRDNLYRPLRISQFVRNHPTKRRMDHGHDCSVSQKFTGNGSLRSGWCHEPAGPRECHSLGGQILTNEEVVRKWYAAGEKKDWGPVDSLFADNFTFTSAAGDDHISKSTFKARCCETQIDFIAPLTWSGSPLARRMLLRSIFVTPRTVNRSGTWSISE